jgi:hypothetical protein
MRLLVLAAAVGVAACADSTAPTIHNLTAAKLRWAQRGFHDYTYTSQRSCFCLNVNPIRVTVVHDTVQTAFDLTANAQVDRGSVSTIDGVFASIDKSLDDNIPVDAEFDARLGYPVKVTYNAPAIPVDGGGYLFISNLRAGAP